MRVLVLPSSRVVFFSSTCGESKFQEFSSPRVPFSFFLSFLRRKRNASSYHRGASPTPMMKRLARADPSCSRCARTFEAFILKTRRFFFLYRMGFLFALFRSFSFLTSIDNNNAKQIINLFKKRTQHNSRDRYIYI